MDWLTMPLVALILGLVALTVLTGPIVRKLDKLTRATRDGIHFDPQPSGGQPKLESLPTALGSDSSTAADASGSNTPKAESVPQATSLRDLMAHPISATALERERVVAENISKLSLTKDEQVALLTRGVASVNVDLEFTRIAHLIFGSQVTLLVQLAGTPNGLPRQEVEAIYGAAKTHFPDLHRERPLEQ